MRNRLALTGSLIAIAALSSSVVSAERLFGYEKKASPAVAEMGLAADVLFRSAGDGNRLIVEIGGFDPADTSVFKSCVEDTVDPEVAQVCTFKRPVTVIARGMQASGNKVKEIQRTREAIVLAPPALPSLANVANVANCTMEVLGSTIIDEACADFEPVAEYCLHVGGGAAAEVLWRPVPTALHVAIMEKPRRAAFVVRTRLADGTLIKSVNKLAADHPALTAAEAEETIATASAVDGAEGAAACTAFHALIRDTDPVTPEIEAALAALEG